MSDFTLHSEQDTFFELALLPLLSSLVLFCGLWFSFDGTRFSCGSVFLKNDAVEVC